MGKYLELDNFSDSTTLYIFTNDDCTKTYLYKTYKNFLFIIKS